MISRLLGIGVGAQYILDAIYDEVRDCAVIARYLKQCIAVLLLLLCIILGSGLGLGSNINIQYSISISINIDGI